MKMQINKFFWLIFPVLLMAFCSGCGTIGQHVMPSYPPVKSPVYIGTCGDVGEIFSKDKGQPTITRVVCCVDLPFSLVADTLWLPFDLYDYHLKLEEANLLKGWTFKPFQNLNSHNNNHLEQVIVDDYEDFIKQNGLNVVSIIMGLHEEDGKGQYAVDFDVGAGSDTFHYYLFYDKNGKRIKVIKYYRGHSSC